MRWEMAENPIFESPTTNVLNPTFEENGYWSNIDKKERISANVE